MINVLMVCLGNICRSPMAEAIFKHHVQQAGLASQIATDSAGTGSYHIGETAHPKTLAILKRQGIVHHGRARQLIARDMSSFHYVFGMDFSNLKNIQALSVATPNTIARTGLFLTKAYEQGLVNTDEVPDPYYTGEYERVYELVAKGSVALLQHIRQQQNI